MKKAIFHSNLGGWGGIPCLGSKLRGQKKSKNMNENKHITNLLFTKKYEIWTARFFSMNTFAWHQNWKYLFLRWKVLTYIQISSVSVCIYMEDVCRCTSQDFIAKGHFFRSICTVWMTQCACYGWKMCSCTFVSMQPEKKFVRWPPNFFSVLHPQILYESCVKRNKLSDQNEKPSISHVPP